MVQKPGQEQVQQVAALERQEPFLVEVLQAQAVLREEQLVEVLRDQVLPVPVEQQLSAPAALQQDKHC
ncbi:MAG TPA: hypothetical protein PK644_11400 [bacterium]|nr:hypothetical protein [bacterium]